MIAFAKIVVNVGVSRGAKTSGVYGCGIFRILGIFIIVRIIFCGIGRIFGRIIFCIIGRGMPRPYEGYNCVEMVGHHDVMVNCGLGIM